ncbi:PAS domain-containing protein [Rhodocaloribacter litoris]|uniref:PAS domain-containing protein n=1 Tax=Rhodocaloribacter litoris TaxID=2558931 RepID=UPI00141EB0A7|nr:PAS domain-containing protein [Rhodocaloribacter litoris]QXD16383.1 PAS domain-containing protein [Rhodocaloribacter litoris]
MKQPARTNGLAARRSGRAARNGLPAWLAACPVGAFVVRLRDGRLRYGNAAFAGLVGYPDPGRRSLRRLLVDPGAFEQLLADLREDRCHTARAEAALQHRNGHTVWALLTLSTEAPAGTLPDGHALGFAQEITEYKRTEAALRNENAFLDAVLEHIPVKVFVKDAETLRFLRFNRAAETILGYRRDELIGKTDYDFFPREEADFFVAKDREVLASGKLLDIPEEPIHTRSGVRYLHTQKIPVLDETGRPVYLLGISEDITERKEAERAFQKSRELFLATLEGMLDAYLLLECRRDEDGQVVDFTVIDLNRRTEAGLALPREALIGQPLCERFPVYRTRGLFEQYRQVFETGTPLEHEYQMPGDFPTPGWYYEQVVPWSDGVAIMSRNITERKRAEAALATYAADLEATSTALEARAHEHTLTIHELEAAKRRAERATRQLREANEKLKESQAQLVQSEKMASLGQMAAGIAHEINNPVGFVMSNLNTLSEYIDTYRLLLQHYAALAATLPPDPPPEQARHLQAIRTIEAEEDLDFITSDLDLLMAESHNGLQRIKEIVQGLKSFARVDEAEMQMANVNESLETTLRVIWNELKYRCAVETRFNPLPLIPCYPGKLNQVFMNLLLNAAQAISDHGVIVIETEATETEVIVRITDNGTGIPPEHLPKLFTPFFTTKPVGKGTGLGLSISYGIIQQHHGRIEVESTVGEGTTFTIYLPVSQEPA